MKKSSSMEHRDYVVIYKLNKKYVFISDPALGLRKVNREEFFSWWTGVFFILFPTTDFEKGNENKGLLLRFVYLLKPHKRLVVEILVATEYFLLLSYSNINSVPIGKLDIFITAGSILNIVSQEHTFIFSASSKPRNEQKSRKVCPFPAIVKQIPICWEENQLFF